MVVHQPQQGAIFSQDTVLLLGQTL